MTKKYHERLKCILTNSEKQELGTQMAEAVSRRTEHDKALKSVTASIKSDIAKEDAIISSCSEKIRAGYEFRTVECQDILDFENNKVLTYRLDNGQIIKERTMEPEERQKNLFHDGEVTDIVVVDADSDSAFTPPEPPQADPPVIMQDI